MKKVDVPISLDGKSAVALRPISAVLDSTDLFIETNVALKSEYVRRLHHRDKRIVSYRLDRDVSVSSKRISQR